MVDRTAKTAEDEIIPYKLLKERLNNEIGNIDLRLERVLRNLIEKDTLKVGDEISVTDLAQNLNISRNTASSALKKLQADGLVKAEPPHPYIIVRKEAIYPSKRGNNISISQWSKDKGISLRTKVISCELISRKDFDIQNDSPQDKKIVKKIWKNLKIDEKASLLEIRRLREFRGNKETDKFKRGIIELSLINPEICPDMLADYQNPQNYNLGFHDYFKKKGLILVRSEFEIKAKTLNDMHISPWLQSKKITEKREIEKLKREYPEISQKAFLRINCTSFSQLGPVEFSISYFDTDTLSLESTEIVPLFVG